MRPQFKKILLAVVAVHLAGLVVLAFWGLLTPAPLIIPQKIAVRTVVMRENPGPLRQETPSPPPVAETAVILPPPKEAPQPMPEAEVSLSPAEEKEHKREELIKEQIKKKAEPPKEKKAPPKPVEKTPPPQPKKVEKKKVEKKTKATEKRDVEQKKKEDAAKEQEKKDAKERKALQEKKEAIRRALNEAKNKLNRASSSVSSSKREIAIALPGDIEALSVETLVKGVHGKDGGYIDRLVFSLKNQLSLPERGDVELSLTLDRSGKFVEMAIIKAGSASNKKYVQQKLPALSYPSFGNYFEGLDTYKFEITLRGK